MNTVKSLTAFLLLMAAGLCGVQAEEVTSAAVEHITIPAPAHHPDWFKQSFLDLSEDIEEAAGHGKRLIVYFYQDGCPYCKKLIEHNLAQPEIAGFTRQHFEIIAINIFGSVEVTDTDDEVLIEKDFTKKMKVHFTPTMLVYNEDQQVIFRMNGYYNLDKFSAMLAYLAEKQETRMKFLDYLVRYQDTKKPQLMDAASLSGAFRTAPFNLQAILHEEARPLAVFFAEARCPSCKELHEDILKREKTREFLDQFSLAVIDVHSKEEIVSPAGEAYASRDWVRASGVQFIPTIVFFDNAGTEVFRVDGYVKAFHLQSALDYVLTESYKQYSGFQPFLHDRVDRLEAEGVVIRLMN